MDVDIIRPDAVSPENIRHRRAVRVRLRVPQAARPRGRGHGHEGEQRDIITLVVNE